MADSGNGALATRIKELGDKSTQILLFLSFTIVAVATLESSQGVGNEQRLALSLAMKWWVRALYPIVFGILPLKEFRENNVSWYKFIRGLKFVLLWIATILIVIGISRFVRAVS